MAGLILAKFEAEEEAGGIDLKLFSYLWLKRRVMKNEAFSLDGLERQFM